jgi:hypothetical protein
MNNFIVTKSINSTYVKHKLMFFICSVCYVSLSRTFLFSETPISTHEFRLLAFLLL